MLHMSELADALEASVARVKELEAQVKDFKCEQILRISEMQELLEAQQRISELEDMLAARQPGENDYEAMRIAVGRIVRDVMNFPQAVQARLLGQDMSPLRDALVDSVAEAGFSRAAVHDADGIDAVLNRLDELNNYGISYEVYSELHDLVSAIPTAVPDAVTEVLDAHRCDESAERAYKRTIRAEAERDAALAALEQVRVVTDALRSRYSDNSEAAYFMGQILAALDGAPEPEGKP